MSNQIAQRPKFSVMVNTSQFQTSILNTLRDPERAKRFTAAIVSAVSTNPELEKCDASSVVTAALLGESLNLSPSPQLGHYYLVPFDVKSGEKDEKSKDIYVKKAQFQLGYKGYIQLAIRSGQYKKLNVLVIKEGELVKFDPLNEEIEVNLIEDETERENTPTAGYYAMFEHTNGFRKAIYWSKSKMERHALQYSAGYKAKKGYTFWEKDFDGMAIKTMLRQLISKWGIMSVQIQEVYQKDMAVLTEDGGVEYIDNFENEIISQGEPEECVKPEEAKTDSRQVAESDEVRQVNINDL